MNQGCAQYYWDGVVKGVIVIYHNQLYNSIRVLMCVMFYHMALWFE